MSRDLQVHNRPKTGMKSVHQTQDSRQIKDQKYYLGLLRNRIKAIYEEKARLKKKILLGKQNIALSQEYGAKEAQLKKEILGSDRKLQSLNILIQNIDKEEGLADFLKREISKEKTSREELEKETDTILSKRKDLEDYILMIEAKKEQIERNFERILGESGDEKRKYESMRNEIKKLTEEMSKVDKDIIEKTNVLESAKKDIEKDIKKINYLNRLEEKEEIEKRLEIAKNVLHTYKNERNEIKQKNKKLKVDLRRVITDIKNYEKMKKEMLIDIKKKRLLLKEYQNEKGIFSSYMDLKKRDEKLEEFKKVYPEKRSAALDERKKNEQIIVELTDFISGNLERLIDPKDAGPSMKEISSESDALNRIGKSTIEQLKLEFDLKKKQSEKLTNINERIKRNLKELAEEIAMMNSELKLFSKIDEMKKNYKELEEFLELKKQWLKEMRTYQSNYIHRIQRIKDQKFKKLHMNNLLEQLKDLERKIRHFKSNNDKIRKYIEEKEKEMGYSFLQDNCMDLLEELNQLLCEQYSSTTKVY